MLGRKEKLYQFFPVFLSLSCLESHYYYSSLLLLLLLLLLHSFALYLHMKSRRVCVWGWGNVIKTGDCCYFPTTTYFYLMRSIIIHSSVSLANYFKQWCRTHARCNSRERGKRCSQLFDNLDTILPQRRDASSVLQYL